jgi:hypothetical protein
LDLEVKLLEDQWVLVGQLGPLVRNQPHLGNLEDLYYLGVLVEMNLQRLGNLEDPYYLVDLVVKNLGNPAIQ